MKYPFHLAAKPKQPLAKSHFQKDKKNSTIGISVLRYAAVGKGD
jgi:hypothetical protein